MEFKDDFCFLLKSYSNDILYVDKLIESFTKFNNDSIKLYIVIPKEDKYLFKEYKNKNNVKLLCEEEILNKYLVSSGSNNLSPGYINQQIIKLSFWETKLSKSYLCLDSDFVFIRDFFYSDFLNKNRDSYLFLDHEHDLNIDSIYYEWYQRSRLIKLKIISERFDLKLDDLLNVHSCQIFDSLVLKNFKDEFLNNQNLSYSDLLSISPYEFSWYNFWVQKNQLNKILIKPSKIKMFHMDYQYLYSYMISDLKDLKRSYLGIILNSNWSRKNHINNYGQISFNLIFNVLRKILRNKLQTK